MAGVEEDPPDNSGSRVPVTPTGEALLRHVFAACRAAQDAITTVSRSAIALQTEVNELKEQFRELKADVEELRECVLHRLHPGHHIRVIKVKVSKYAYRRRRRRARRRGPN